ncbi:MAG: hypothetical protein H6825_16235 [Planctomycetes bacterium]|nr:hypothetical protein [Planctomycetota bacterium]
MMRPSRLLVVALLLSLAGTVRVAAQASLDASDPLALLRELTEKAGQPPGEAGAKAGDAEGKKGPSSEPAALPPATPIGEGENTGFVQPSPGLLEFHARNIDVAEAFGQLRLLLRKNIVVEPGLEARFSGDLYDVTPKEAIDVICRSSNLVSYEEGPYIYVKPAQVETVIYRLEHARAEDLVEMIQPMLSLSGAVAGTKTSDQGIVSTPEEAGGDTYASQDVVIVKDLPDVQAAVKELIEVVDAAPLQVLIEATILTAQLIDSEEQGGQLSALLGLTYDVTNASASVEGLSTGQFTSDQLTTGFQVAESHTASQLSTGGINVGFLLGPLGFFLRALRQVTNTNVLASPKVLTLNKQRGEILLGRRDGFITTTTTQTSTSQSVEFLETGTRLVFRPFIGRNGYVRLEIHPEDSDGGLNPAGLPYKETAEVTTNVLVRSGDTIVIGGLFRERQKTIETKVPLLGDLWFLGRFFRGTSDVSVREEVIVVLTPTIIDLIGQGMPQTAGDVKDGSVPLSATWIDKDRLHDSLLVAAKDLLAGKRFGSAALMLDAADDLRTDDAGSTDLRDDVWQEALPGEDGGAVDDLILQKVLAEDDEG